MRKVLAIIFCAVLLLNTIGCGNKDGVNTQVKEDTNFELINTEIGKKLSLKSYQNGKNVLNSKDKQKKYDFENDYIKILKVLDLEVKGDVAGIYNGYGGPIEILSSESLGEATQTSSNTKTHIYWISKEGNIIPEWSDPNRLDGTIIKGEYQFKPKDSTNFNEKWYWGLYDLKGNAILAPEYGLDRTIYNGGFLFHTDSEWVVFDEDLNKLFSWSYHPVPVFDDEFESVKIARELNHVGNTRDYTNFDGEIILAFNGEKFGYLDINGNQLTDFCYDGGLRFAGREYTSVAKRNEHNEYKWGLINKKGNLIIDYIYDSYITGGDDGVFSVNRDGKGFYININNETLLNGLTFDYAESFNPDGLAWVKRNNKWGIIDKNGREVCPCIFDVKSSFIDGKATVSYKNKLLFITYKEPSEVGYTYDDVDKSINEFSKISDNPSFWNSFKSNFRDRISKNNWTEEDYMNDFSYTTTYKSVMPDAWYVTTAGVWYYFEEDRTTTKKGWFNDSRDNQTYYLDTNTGRMAVGWTEIDGDMYYFNESHANEPNWYEVGEGFYESYGKKIKAYGSMYKNEETPDGKKVDEDGKLIK